DLEGHALAVAHHHRGRGLAGLDAAQDVHEVVDVPDRGAGELDEDVAAAQARLLGRATRAGAGEQHAGRAVGRADVVRDGAQRGAVRAHVGVARRRRRHLLQAELAFARRERAYDARRELGDAGAAGGIDGRGVVRGLVVVVVDAGEEVQHRDAGGVERRLVGRAVTVAAELAVEPELVAGLLDQRSPLARRAA